MVVIVLSSKDHTILNELYLQLKTFINKIKEAINM